MREFAADIVRELAAGTWTVNGACIMCGTTGRHHTEQCLHRRAIAWVRTQPPNRPVPVPALTAASKPDTWTTGNGVVIARTGNGWSYYYPGLDGAVAGFDTKEAAAMAAAERIANHYSSREQ